MILKSDISEWLRKCQSKAVDSVNKEMMDKILEYSKMFPVIQEDMKRLAKIQSEIDEIITHYGDDMGFYTRPKIYSSECLLWFFNEYALTIAFLKKNDNEKLDEIVMLRGKRKRVSREYDTLIEKVRRIRRPEKAVQYLKDLGFDVSSLVALDTGNKESIDKKLLFVCGDNKPNIAKEGE